MTKKLVSIIVVTAGRLDTIEKCLNNLVLQSYPNYEIIIIDSSPNEDTRAIVERFRQIRYLRSPVKNTPYQRNLGIKMAEGEIIAFIDDDGIADKDWLENLVCEYKNDWIGAVGGKVHEVFSGDDTGNITNVDLNGPIGKVLDNGKMVSNFGAPIGSSVEVDHLIGCNMSFSKAALILTGMFDPEFKGTCFCEETDTCIRVKNAGYKVIFTPKALVTHLLAPRASHSRSRFNMRFQYFHARNKSYFYVKNFFFGKKTLSFLLRDTYEHLKIYLIRILHTMALILVNIFAKIYGILLAFKYLILSFLRRAKK